ncbi:MAG TPA: ABC transporter substrate-binding protein [Candidatus Tectomicrobia bacterium]|nr:ABC transporter substrate-binding protein [Candidatus Tectomicrobia bacterium]
MRLRRIGRIVTLVLGLLVAPCAAAASTHVPRIGVLSQFSPPSEPSAPFEGLRAGLHQLGYLEGRNVALEYRYAEGRYERLSPLAAELVRLPVDVLVALSPPAIRAAVQATATLPIVGIGVPTGAVANVTGVATGAEAFRRTWHALMTEALPGASQVALLWDATMGPPPGFWARATARVMGIHLQLLMVPAPDTFERAFAAALAGQADVMLVPESELFHQYRTQIAALAVQTRLPTVALFRDFAEAGCLIAYGPNLQDLGRWVAVYVDKLLKGATPAALPVGQPAKLELVINLKTAKALGLTLPASFLARADKVIQ